MLGVYQHIHLEFLDYYQYPVVQCVDNGLDWYISCHLYCCGQPEIIPDGYSVQANWLKEDGSLETLKNTEDNTIFIFNENVVTFRIPDEILNREGLIKMRLQMVGDTNKLSAPWFWIVTEQRSIVHSYDTSEGDILPDWFVDSEGNPIPKPTVMEEL